MDIATPNLTSSTCEIVPMRAVSWHACLRKASWQGGVVTGIYRPPGIAGAMLMLCTPIVQGLHARHLRQISCVTQRRPQGCLGHLWTYLPPQLWRSSLHALCTCDQPRHCRGF